MKLARAPAARVVSRQPLPKQTPEVVGEVGAQRASLYQAMACFHGSEPYYYCRAWLVH